MEEEFKPNDIAYVVLVHNKNHNNIEFYVDKVRVCLYEKYERYDFYYTDHKFNNEPLSNECTARRRYRPHRLFKTFEEAQKYADFKNEEKKIRIKYYNQINNLKKDLLEDR